MTISRREFTLALGAAALGSALPTARAADLEPFKFAIGSKTVTPILAAFTLPEQLGYYAQEGLTVDVGVLGSNANTMLAAAQGRLDAFVGVPSFFLPAMASDKHVDIINYFEYAYPFKWAFAIKPEAPYKAVADLKGQTIGVVNFGTSDYTVGKSVVRLAGLDPEKDVKWLAVGDGVTAGYALQKGDVAALFYGDVGMGIIEGAGIKLNYLPKPENVAKIGGLYLAATREKMAQKRKQLVGFARGVAKAQVYILANPEAAAHIFVQVYPDAAPRNKSMQEKVAAVLVPITKRMQFFNHYDKSVTKWGQMTPGDVKDDIEFLDLSGKINEAEAEKLFSNDLIDEINNFDADKIRAQARAYKLPWKS
jgi:NitT/TauT family transport system substrate-binding protein